MATPERLLATTAILLAAAAIGGCGGADGGREGGSAGSPLTDPAATEAAPEAQPAEPAGGQGELSEDDRAAVLAATRGYIAALNRGDGTAVCERLTAGALAGVRLRGQGACVARLDGSIGRTGAGGAPAWKRTNVEEVKAVSVGGQDARVTATVVHVFSDRDFPSVEDDVIYLRREPDGWKIAKASATLYRAVGYPEPPLRAFRAP